MARLRQAAARLKADTLAKSSKATNRQQANKAKNRKRAKTQHAPQKEMAVAAKDLGRVARVVVVVRDVLLVQSTWCDGRAERWPCARADPLAVTRISGKANTQVPATEQARRLTARVGFLFSLQRAHMRCWQRAQRYSPGSKLPASASFVTRCEICVTHGRWWVRASEKEKKREE